MEIKHVRGVPIVNLLWHRDAARVVLSGIVTGDDSLEVDGVPDDGGHHMQSEAISDSTGKQPTAASGAGTYSRNQW